MKMGEEEASRRLRQRLWLAVLVLVLPAGGTARAEADAPVVATLDAAGLARLRGEGVTVIDIRRPDEWRATGVIPGSKLITAYDADGRLVPGFLAEVERRGRQGPSGGADLPLRQPLGDGGAAAHGRCRRRGGAGSGNRSVYSVAGGIGAWSAAAGPLVPCPTC